MRKCGLIGDPVDHSLSPAMHNAAFRHYGIRAEYALWPTPEPGVSARVGSLRAGDVLGANVTVPHKQAVMSLIDTMSEAAHRIGAVNTIVSHDGTLHGDNTDAYGFEALATGAEVSVARRDVALVLGAGGASRAVIVALQALGFARIVIANRSPERAETLARELGRGDVIGIGVDRLGGVLPEASMVVNATSLGWHNGETPLDSAEIGTLVNDTLVIDLTYRDTDLLRMARARGITAVDGLDMLIHQGARAFTLWTSLDAPVDVMRDAVKAEQASRARG